MACMVISMQAIGQSGQMAEDGYYVVINAYAQSKEAYATRYFEKIKGDGDEVSYAFVPAKNMYFVYLEHTMNYREAIDGMRNARKDSSK